MTFKKVLNILTALVILFVTGLAVYYVGHQRESALNAQIRDLQIQLAHARIPMQTGTIRDSLPTASQQAVEVDKTDYKKQLADRKLIKDLELQISQVKAENTMLRETLGKVRLEPVRPAADSASIEHADSISAESDTLLAYHDQWVDFLWNTSDSTLAYSVRDSLKTYIDRIPKHKFLWWHWGTKGYLVKHVNFNPNSKIKYSQTIIVK